MFVPGSLQGRLPPELLTLRLGDELWSYELGPNTFPSSMREPGGWWRASLGPVLTPSHLALCLWVFPSAPSLFPGSVTLFLRVGGTCLL